MHRTLHVVHSDKYTGGIVCKCNNIYVHVYLRMYTHYVCAYKRLSHGDPDFSSSNSHMTEVCTFYLFCDKTLWTGLL